MSYTLSIPKNKTDVITEVAAAIKGNPDNFIGYEIKPGSVKTPGKITCLIIKFNRS